MDVQHLNNKKIQMEDDMSEKKKSRRLRVLFAAAVGGLIGGVGVILPVFNTEITGTATPYCNTVSHLVWTDSPQLQEVDRYYRCDGGLKEIWVDTIDSKFLVGLDTPAEWNRDDKPFEPGEEVTVSFKSSLTNMLLHKAVSSFLRAQDPEEYEYIYHPTYGGKPLVVPLAAIQPKAP